VKPGESVSAKAPPSTDVAAFKEELLSLLPQLRAFCRFLCQGEAHAADDLVQETLTRAWTARDSFTMGTSMRAWLFVIARNQHYSTKRRSRFVAAYDPAYAEQALQTEGAQQDVMELDEVRRALDLLPQDQRDALVLVTAGGLSYEEAATICGCAVGTIKSRVNRARGALTKILDQLQGLPKPDRPAETALDSLVEDARRLSDEA
jgi:RNA polymerase sigma factor (sigma-70 family)